MIYWLHVRIRGFFVHDVDNIPDGYVLRQFPASEYLMITTEWLDKHERSVGHEGNGRCNGCADRIAAPAGYERYDEGDAPIHRIEVEVEKDGMYRYEVWVPIRKKQQRNLTANENS